MRVRLKGDVICTLLLLVALCSLLYSQLEHLVPAGNKEPTQKKPPAAPKIFSDPRAPQRLMPAEATAPRPQVTPIIRRAPPPNNRVQTTTPPPPTPPAFNFKHYLLNKDNPPLKLLINQPRKCQKPPPGPFLLIAIKSVVAPPDRREIVRKTWGRDPPLNGQQIQRVFLLGPPPNRTVLATWETLIPPPSQTYRDILLWDFIPPLFNLTLKEIHFLSPPPEFCRSVKFIFKGAPPVFVNIENIVDFLNPPHPTEDLFVGDIIYPPPPIRVRNSKYFIPAPPYGLSIYPAYAGGGPPLLSGRTMSRLSRAPPPVELFPIDDVFLGTPPQRISLKPILHEGFPPLGIVKPSAAPHLQPPPPCFYKDLMVVHSPPPAEIWLMWNLLHSPPPPCTQKKQVKKPFQPPPRAQTTAQASPL
ncbi:B3GN9 acetylglucosaminyltransferase, partial [Neopipo cinnamomea]|nr:B3GN9 acetylglucosaminyltransferase [Neopipo cinnamomea]